MIKLKVNWEVFLITLIALIFMMFTFAGIAVGKKNQDFKIQDTSTFITKDGFNHVADHYVNSNFRIYIFATDSNGMQLSNPVVNATGSLIFTGPNNQKIIPNPVNIVNSHGSVEISFPVTGKWVAEFDTESGRLKHKCEFNIVANSANLSIVPNTPTILTSDLLEFKAIYSSGQGSETIDVTNLAEWSSNNSIASIDNKTGLATAGPSPGQSLITVTYMGLSATTTLEIILRTITIEPSAATIAVGSEYQFTSVYSDGYNPTTVTWSSSNSDLASVDQSGKVSGIGIGIVIIAVTDPDTGISGTAEITVTPAESSKLVIEPKDAVIIKNSSQQFDAYFMVTPSIKIPINLFLEWSSVDSNIATVSNSGLALGIKVGTTIIQVSFKLLFLDYTSSAQLEVIVPDRIELTQDKTTIYLGDHAQFQASLVYNGDQKRDITTDNAITWSSDSSAVTISNQGLGTGISAGTSNITAEAYGVSASTPLMVVQPAITIVPDVATIRVGSHYEFKLEYPSGYIPISVTWSTSDDAIATVDQIGRVSGHGVGTVTITATDPNAKVSGTASVHVNLPRITIVPSEVTIPVGSTHEFLLEYSAGYSPTTVTWSTNDATIATLDQTTGIVSGHRVGTVTITATDPDAKVSGTATVTVNLPTITIVPGSVTIPVGSNHQFAIIYSPGYSPFVLWTTSNNNLAPVSPSGLVTGSGSGTFTITATDPATGVSGTALITVAAPVTPPSFPQGWGPNWRIEGPYN